MDDRRHFGRYTAGALADLVTDAGFAVVEQRASVWWLFVAAKA